MIKVKGNLRKKFPRVTCAQCLVYKECAKNTLIADYYHEKVKKWPYILFDEVIENQQKGV